MHRRRRTALAVLAATLVAAPLLSACGNQTHPGAAAVVGGERIEVSVVQARAADVRSAQDSSPEAAQLVNKSGQLNRAKLHGLIFGRVLDRAAADAGVTVTRKEVQEMRKANRAQQGGEAQFEAMMLQQRWVAPDQIDADMRQEVQLPKLAAALGADLGTPALPAGRRRSPHQGVEGPRHRREPALRHLGRPEDAARQLQRALDHPGHRVRAAGLPGGRLIRRAGGAGAGGRFAG